MGVTEPIHSEDPERNHDDVLMLVCAAQSGDQRAFQSLYERFCVRPVFTLALGMLGDRSLAEDTTQDIFVKVHRELPQFDAQRGTFTAWLVVIARNVCIDAQRKQRLRAFLSHHLSPAHEQTIAAAASDPLDYVIGLEEHERFQQALTRLSPSLRAVVDHVIVQRQSYSDAAAALGCTTGAIGASLSKAKEKLKRYLKETT